MTVNYSFAASTATAWKFVKLLFYWRGGVFKLVWFELIVWFSIYITLFLTYHFVLLDEERKTQFTRLVSYCSIHRIYSEVILMLGFFTAAAIARFWAVYQTMWWPDNAAMTLATYLRSTDQNEPKLRILRKTCARYLMLCFILILRDVSKPVRSRFPTLKFLVDHGGLMTQKELEMLENCMPGFPICKYFVPIQWLVTLLKEHYTSGHLKAESVDLKGQNPTYLAQYAYNDLIKEILTYRGMCADVLTYDWVPIPLAYTQLCVMVVYFFLVTSLLSEQMVEWDSEKYWDLGKPFLFATIQLVTMIGLIKTALNMLNPFGTGDDDLEVSWLLDRHWETISKMLERPMLNFPVQSLRAEESIASINLPHTFASHSLMKRKKQNPMVGSVAKVKVRKSDAQPVPLQPRRPHIKHIITENNNPTSQHHISSEIAKLNEENFLHKIP